MSRPRTLAPRCPEEAPLIVQMKFRGPEAARIRELMEQWSATQGEVGHRLISEALEARKLRAAS